MSAARRRIAILVAVALAATACTSGPDDPVVPPPQPTVGPPPEGTIRVAYPAEPATLNPVSEAGAAAATRDILRPTLPSLFRLDARLRPVPELAAAMPTRATGEAPSISVRLRDEAVWSDGTPVTAADVRFTWQRLRNGPTRSRYRLLRDVEVAGDKTVVLHFSRPVRRWWSLFSIDDPILPAHAFGDGSVWDRSPPVSGGPFAVEGWTPGLKIRLRRNPAWWGPGPGVEAIEILFVADDEMRLQLLERREVDVVVAEGEANYGRRAAARGAAPVEGPLDGRPAASGAWAPAWWELNVNLSTMGGTGVPAALATGLDRRLAVEILEDSGQVMNGIPPRFPAGGAEADGLPAIDGPWASLPGDTAGARSALPRSDRGREVRLVLQRGSLAAGAIARLIHFRMREVGFRVEIVAIDAPQFVRDFLPDRQGDAFLVLRRGADAPDTAPYRSESGGSTNASAVSSVDALVDAAEVDAAAFGLSRAGLVETPWARVQEALRDSGAVQPLARVRSWIVSLGGVAGPHATGSSAGAFWNAAEWTVDR